MKLVQHIGLIHAHEANFTITCGLDDCQSTFTKHESFRRHVYRKHRESVSCPDNGREGVENEVAYEESDEPRTNAVFGNSQCMDDDNPIVIENPRSVAELLLDFKDNLFKFILKCREKKHLPVSVQQEIVDDVNFLLCFFKENYDAFIAFHLQKSGFDLSQSPELTKVIQSNDFF